MKKTDRTCNKRIAVRGAFIAPLDDLIVSDKLHRIFVVLRDLLNDTDGQLLLGGVTSEECIERCTRLSLEESLEELIVFESVNALLCGDGLLESSANRAREGSAFLSFEARCRDALKPMIMHVI